MKLNLIFMASLTAFLTGIIIINYIDILVGKSLQGYLMLVDLVFVMLILLLLNEKEH